MSYYLYFDLIIKTVRLVDDRLMIISAHNLFIHYFLPSFLYSIIVKILSVVYLLPSTIYPLHYPS